MGNDPDAACVRKLHQQRARIGYGRKTCFRNQRGILLPEPGGIRLDLLARRMFVEFQEFQFVHTSLPSGRGQEAAGGAQLFYEEEPDIRQEGEYRCGKCVIRVGVAERGRYQVKLAVHRWI